MPAADETIIELSKAKVTLILIGAAVFVAVGIWIMTLDSEAIRAGRSFRLFFNSPYFAYGLGVVSIVFFGGLGMFAVKKLIDKRPGLIFNSEGIVDNASIAAPGLIPWADIAGMQIFEMSGQKMLIVLLHDPQKYAQVGNPLKRMINKANANMSGSPIYISANSLDIGFPELISLFDRYYEKYGESRNSAVPPSR